MFLAKIVLSAFTSLAVTNYIFVAGQDDIVSEETEDPVEGEPTEPPPIDNHTVVAMLDIVFTDGSKRRCTGTIIHDYVVITAAHCFLDQNNNGNDVELTASFVIIGTKKMYDTGYETYLPIERIVTHPKFKGWTADIALVFTFAGMTTDKPGNVMPLIEESTMTPVDSNVTILSWGICKADQESCERHVTSPTPLRMAEKNSKEVNEREHESKPHRGGKQGRKHKRNKEKKSPHIERLAEFWMPTPEIVTIPSIEFASPPKSRYLTDEEKEIELDKVSATFRHSQKRYLKTSRATSRETPNIMVVQDKTRREFEKQKSILDNKNSTISKDEKNEIKPPKNSNHTYFYRRRSMSAKRNKLSIETFGFVNVQTCKKIVDKALPRLYAINPNEVVCYAADGHYMNDDDSGAPAVRHGHLVAMTLGGVECEDNHVAVGVKMSCFCSWVAENIPGGGKELKCCKNCCNGKDDSNNKNNNQQTSKHRNKYLYK